jgi:hypothetical protein
MPPAFRADASGQSVAPAGIAGGSGSPPGGPAGPGWLNSRRRQGGLGMSPSASLTLGYFDT